MRIIFFLAWGALMTQAGEPVNINKLWNFQDPKATRARFHALRLELLTQIARTHGLEGEFDKSHAILDEVEKQLESAPPVVKVRYLLERGRTFNSSGKVDKAMALFHESFALAKEVKEHGYAVDALHMLGYAEKDQKVKLGWEEKAVAYAEKTQDERALKWLGTLYNNIGWSYAAMGDYRKALASHEHYVTWCVKHAPGTRSHRIARWCVGKQLRMLKRYEEATKIQLELEAEYKKLGEKDGFVQEELGEIYLAEGKADTAKPYFERAYEILKDTYVKNEKERIERLKTLAGK